MSPHSKHVQPISSHDSLEKLSQYFFPLVENESE